WEGFNIIKDTQVGPFVVSSNGLAYQTLEEALAVATEEDTITVIQEGVYKGIQNTGLLIEKSVTIAAAGNLAVTFDCEENNNFITVAANKVVNLKDIKIINGKATNGGAVNVLSGGKLSVNNVNFVNNLATKTGGAINAEDGSYVVIMRSNFTSNTANGENTFPSGGAVCIGDAFAAITSSVFTDNQGGNSAGAVYIGADNFLINDCTFVGNKANGGSAGALWVHGWTGKVEGCTFDSNEARDFGGAIEWRVKEGTLVDSTFKDNKAAQGGAIHWSGIDGKIEGTNVFTGNEATQNGGAIFWEGTSGTVKGANFTSNKAGAAAHGNAIYWAGASGTVEDSIFDSNTGGAGAIIWLGEGGNIKGSYFANNGVNPDVFNIYKLADDLNIEANTFEISTATIKADKDEYTYGDSAIITGNFIWGVNNNPIGLIVDSTRGSTDIDFTVENFVNGPFTYELTNLLPGEYTVAIVDFTETAKNNKFIIAATALDDFIVNKAKADVTVTADTVTYPTQATVVVNANVPGTYTIRVGNKDYEIEVGEEGTASKVIDLLEPGTYDIDLSADLGPNYEPISQIPAGSLTVLAQEGPFVVSSNGLGYATLAEALAVAQATGDTITVVEAGTYTGAGNIGVLVNKDVTIKAGEGLKVVFDAAKADTNILTIANGNDVKLEGLAFTGVENTNTKFGAVVNHGTLTVTDCEFYDNTVKVNGGAGNNGAAAIFSATDATGLTITGSTFKNNVATPTNPTDHINTGGIGAVASWATSGTVKIIDSVFENNEARFGGAVEIENLNQIAPAIVGCNFTDNIAYVGAGINFNDGCIVENIANCTFTGNTIKGPQGAPTTGSMGAAICAGSWTDDSVLMLDGCKFIENKGDASDGSSGGAIRLANKASGIIINSEFIGNEARIGSAISIGTINNDNAYLIVDNCNFTDNNAFMYGAVSIDSEAITTTITRSTFSGNTAPDDRNIFNMGTLEGIERNTFDINDTTIEVNNIPYGEDEVINGTFDAGVSYDLTGSTVSLTINGAEVTATVTDGNKFTTTITKPDVGTYPVVFNNVTDSDKNVYLPVNPVETSYTVYKAVPIVEVNDTTAEWGVPVTIPVKVTDENGNPITGSVIVTVDWTVDGVTQVVELDENGYGEATFVITGALGDATITANYTGNDNYESVKGTATLIINDTTEMDITVTANEVDYGQDTIITVTAVNARDVAVTLAKVNVTIDDGEAQELEVGADGTINLGSLAAGEHNIVVTANDGIHKEATNSTVAVVNPIAAEVNASAANYAFDETGKLIVNVTDLAGNPLSGVVAVEIDDELYAPEVEITGGRVEIDLTGFEIGEHSVHVVFTNPNYRVVDAVTHFNVTKKTPTISVEADDDLMPGDPAFVTVTVKDGNKGINGTAIVTVDGTNYAVEIIDGEGQVIITDLVADEYTIAAKFLENDNYTEAVYTGDAVIDFMMHYASYDLIVENITYGEGFVVTIKNVKDVDGNLLDGTVSGQIVDANGQGKGLGIITITNGEGSRTYTGLNVGNYSVTTYFDGMDDDYVMYYGDKNASATVSKAQSDIAVTYENGNFTITLDGVNGEKLNETVTVAIDGTPVDIAARTDNGTFSFIDNGIAPGDHTVVVSFEGNRNYLGDFANLGFNVPKEIPVISVTGATVDYGQPATVKFTVSDPDGLPVTTGSVIVTVDWLVDGETQVVELVEGSGEATFALAGVAPGTVNITVTYIENDKYASAVNDTEKITIKDSTDLSLEATSNEVTYGGDTILNVVATDGKGAQIELSKVNITIDGVTTEYPVDEDGNVNIGKLPAGDTEITVSIDDEVYGHVETKVNATVSPAVPDLTVTPGVGNITIDVKDGETPISGTATVVIDGDSEHPITVQIDETGHAVVPIDAAPGNHAVEVIFTNDNYTEARQTVAVTVPKAIPVVEVNDTTTEWGVPVTIPVKVTDENGDPLTGTVIVTVDWTVDGETQVVELDENGYGEATFVVNGALGDATITANYTGNDNYESVKETASLTITESTVLNLEVTANEVTYGEDTILTVTATNGRGVVVPLVRVNLTIDGVTEMYPVIDGQVTVGKLPAGVTEINVSISGGVYQDAEAAVNATVNPAVPDLVLTPGEGNITIDVFDGDYPISGNATVIVDGDTEHPIEVTIDETGHAVVPIDAAPGAHTVEVTFAKENYENVTKVATVTVPKVTPIVYVNGTEVEYGTPATINITVTDEEGNPINGTVIVVASWEVGGETQVVELVDGKGEATFTLAGLDQGETADVNATFVATDKYASAFNDTEKIKITPSSELKLEVTADDVTVGEDTVLTITATDGAGAAVDLAKVNVTINGETKEYPVVDGKVNIGQLPVGTTEITVSYDDEFYEPAQDTVEATVNKLAADVEVSAGNGTVDITAKDNKTGEPISGTATIVVDGGEPIEVPIGEDGTIEYPIEAAPGPHTVEVTFTNDDYEPVTKTVTVVVPKYEATLSIANTTAPVYGQDVTIAPTLAPADATGTITYYVDGATTGTQLPKGENFVVSGLTAGEHTIKAKYSGDENYSEAESNVLTLNVEKAQLVFTIEDVIAYYPNAGTVNVVANNDGEYTINVNNKPYTVTVENGKGTVTDVELGLEVGEYDITWSIPDSDNYIGTEGSAKYTVVPAAPEFSITGSPEINYGQTNTIVPTLTEGATGTITYTIDGTEFSVTKPVGEEVVIEGLDAGDYTVTATYSGDDNYGTVKAYFNFKVLPIDVVVSVASDEVYYPNTGSINLTASAPGTYTVLVGNKTYTAVVTEAGVPVVVEVEQLEVGKYEINVTADASTNYNKVETGAIGTYVVSKAQSAIEVTYDPATGKATVTLEGKEDHVKLSESISFELDGQPISGVKTVDGVYVSEDLALAPGKHSIFVVFVGNENYLGSYDQVAFEVDKFSTAEVTVSADPIKEGEDAIIKITVKDGDKGLSGVVTVTLDGTDYAVDVTDGEGTLTVKNLVATETPTTEYPITAKFNGNDEYAEATGEGSIFVTDYNDVIIVISGGDETAQATLIDSDLNPINGKVNVTVDGGAPQELNVVDGKVIIPVDDEGDHDITVDYLGDDTHKPATESATVFVGKKLIPTNMVLTVSDITYTENEEVVVVLTAEDGTQMSGTVKLTIGDVVKEITVTNGQGKTTISGLNAGTKTAIAEFVSDGTYAGTVVTSTFNVRQMKTRIIARNMTTTAINVTEDGRIGQYFTWTLVDEKGRPLEGKAMSIGFNANVYNRVTNASGQARLQINLQNSGPYTFAITFLGDDNYEGSFEVVKIDVNKQKAQLTASGATYKASAKTKTLSATYKTKAGKAIVGKTVKFTVNGKTYSAKTDSKGVAKVNVSLTKAGSYTVKITAPATNTYAEVNKTVTLKLT
uniref:Ig-like domain repeat protein n=1 Tax=Methanobrevibacter sp. TaxID=66852 RepID=UPI00388D322C